MGKSGATPPWPLATGAKTAPETCNATDGGAESASAAMSDCSEAGGRGGRLLMEASMLMSINVSNGSIAPPSSLSFQEKFGNEGDTGGSVVGVASEEAS